MKTFLTLFIFIISSNIFAMQDEEVAVDEKIKPIRIGLFIDNHMEKYSGFGSIAITLDFTAELHQKFLDIIIVSDYILKNLILRKYTKTSNPELTKISFDLTDWDIYYIENTQFFVFVQPGYDNPILNKTLWKKVDFDKLVEYKGDKADKQRPVIQWKDMVAIKAKKLLSHEGLKYIPYAKDLKSTIDTKKMPEKKFEPIQLSWIFKPVKNYDELSLAQPCNVYISGHGGPYKKKHMISGIPSDDMVNLLLFFNDKLNTKSIRMSSCSSGGKALDLMRIKNSIPIRIKYLLIVESITDAATVSTYKKTGGLELVDTKGYFEALEEFQGGYDVFAAKLQAIKTKKRLLSGEAEQEIKDEIQELEENSGFNGILKTLPLTEEWYYEYSGLNNFPQIWIPEIGWFQTFNIDPYVKKITDARILKAMARPISKKDAPVLQYLEFDFNKTFQIDKCFAILLYSEIVYSFLEIKPNVSKDFALLWMSAPWLSNLREDFPSQNTLCLYPQIITMQRGDSLNLFAKISLLKNSEGPLVETGILNFLRDSFFVLRDRTSTNKFFIKELEGFNDFSEVLDKKDPFKKELDAQKLTQKQITLQNVFIETSMELEAENKMDLDVENKLEEYNEFTCIKLSFEFDGKPWVLLYEKQDLELVDNSLVRQSLWKFEQKNIEHLENIESSGLSYLAKLNPAEYYAQLPVIRDMFHHEKTKIQINEPAKTISLKDFLLKLNPKDIQKEVSLEQQILLQKQIKNLKGSLVNLKEKFSMLKARLEQLKIKLQH